MATAIQTWQTTLNVVGSIVTIATGSTNGSQISSIHLANTNASTARTVTLLHGGDATANIITYVTIQPNDSIIIQMPNCPIILKNSVTLKGYQDTGNDVNVLACGLEM